MGSDVVIAALTFSMLEPLAGAGLATNLAYLALNPHRYRELVEPHASNLCDEKKAELESIENFSSMDSVKEIHWLSRRSPSKDFAPTGKGGFAYRYFVRKRTDEILVAIAAATCLAILVLGVGQNIGLIGIPEISISEWVVMTGFFFCNCAILFPIGAVILGRKCAEWGQNRVSHCRSQIAIFLAAMAADTKPPEGVT